MYTGLLIAGGVVAIYLIVYNTSMKLRRCKSSATLHGKTAIVTGANTGIGKTTALDLAKRGARVILACRNQQRAEAAVRDIKRVRNPFFSLFLVTEPRYICHSLSSTPVLQESGNDEVVYMNLDLGSLQSVRSFTETFLKTEPRLDLLINNAGIFLQGKTEDGFGMIFGVNHLGHFLLTLLLLERLKESGSSRVVNVSSSAHIYGAIDFNCLSTHKELGVGDTAFQVFQLYSHSKLCNVLFTHELAKRLQGTSVTCYSLHPGVVRTGITRYSSIWWQILLIPGALLFCVDADSGAQTTLHCALQEGIEPLSGCYFSDCAVVDLLPKAKDDAVARKLWEVSERLSGLC
ncbi:dehydrogenase/reductase SDR family member 13-like isoform X1 [Conger conger]|uniref:dehydrogenase/reductase SDR family member 13-like isoform X1 n=1 Tax=Conger conger TaxID=82655 RepID=UPI002A59EF5C|nr:dehydrogenase/reductase SDR family member 13-like isoform X1 [Conger conger]